jgi:microcystin-dependent protein
MSQPYVGEIRMFGGNFAPAGWMFCEGQLLPISEFDTLFNLIGTTYGGDGQSTFALPDLRGRLPIHQGGGFALAANGGVEQVTLSTSQIPAHSHAFLATTNVAATANPQGSVLGALNVAANDIYIPAAGAAALSPNTISATGRSQPHSNFQPYLCVDFIISLFGVFPSQN